MLPARGCVFRAGSGAKCLQSPRREEGAATSIARGYGPAVARSGGAGWGQTQRSHGGPAPCSGSTCKNKTIVTQSNTTWGLGLLGGMKKPGFLASGPLWSRPHLPSGVTPEPSQCPVCVLACAAALGSRPTAPVGRTQGGSVFRSVPCTSPRLAEDG